MLTDILYGLLLLVVALAILGVFKLIRRLRHTSDIPIERLFILMLVLLLSVFLTYLVVNAKIYTFGNHQNTKQSQTAKEIFIEKLYAPLFLTQKKLSSQILNLRNLQKNILDLRNVHPQQKNRIEFIYATWNHERKALVALKINFDRAVHRAWSYHGHVDQAIIEDKFSREAVDWDKAITVRLLEYERRRLKITRIMLDNVVAQHSNLLNTLVGNKIVLPKEGALPSSVFSEKTIGQLVGVFKNLDMKQGPLLDVITAEIKTAAQKRREVRNYSLDKPDFKGALQRVMNEWFIVEAHGIYYRDQILHAIQAGYLAKVLGVNPHENEMIRLDRTIKQKLPILLNGLQNARKAVENSYQFSSRPQ